MNFRVTFVLTLLSKGLSSVVVFYPAPRGDSYSVVFVLIQEKDPVQRQCRLESLSLYFSLRPVFS